MNKSTKRIALGAVIAGIGGYLAGILTAPKSGRETREDLKDAAAATTAEAEKRLKQLHTELGNLLSQAREKGSKYTGKAKVEFDKLVSATNIAKQKAREILSAIHEGEVEDKDLQKVVSETSNAAKHLKAFLRKKPT